MATAIYHITNSRRRKSIYTDLDLSEKKLSKWSEAADLSQITKSGRYQDLI
jgi:hypothetical protein